MDNIIDLHKELKNKTYIHHGYKAFKISDPKPRNIHKASVRDRLLHHAIYRMLYPFFDRTFIADSYSCRMRKGTHKAMDRFNIFTKKLSKNHTKTAWVLKCDIKKFFDSIDHAVLREILSKYILDQNILNLLSGIIGSFESKIDSTGVGLPLGNLTSQLFVNIYMNEFDQFMKHKIKAKYYIRYADDFVIMDNNKDYLIKLLPKINDFLNDKLKLTLHHGKVFIKTVNSGVDFLGWIHFTDHRVLRTSTKRRMFRNLKSKKPQEATVQSYLGLFKHGNAKELGNKIRGLYL